MRLPFELLAVSGAGATIGCVTGLLPSLHVNTLAILLLAAAPVLSAGLRGVGLVDADAGFYVAAFVLAISVAHTFINIVPATYLGAPDESTALSVLPGHKMLLRGTGYRAVQLSAHASQWALLFSVAAVMPLRWVLGPPMHLFDAIRAHVFWIVLLLALLLVLTETAKIGPRAWSNRRRRWIGRACSLLLLATSAAYGLLLNHQPYSSVVRIPPSPLLPALSGLFGAATILTALTLPPRMPHQFLRIRHRDIHMPGAAAAIGAGLVAGATMSILPGLTNASATAIATTIRKGTDEETIVSLSAVNTANAVFNLAVLYLFARSRSGAVIAMEQLHAVRSWRDVLPTDLAWYGYVTIASGLLSLFVTLWIGRLFVRRIQAVPYRPLMWSVLAYMVLVVIVFTGAAGLLVFLTGTALGIVPVKLGVRRTSLTGVLLGPVLYYLAPPGLALR
jgi:putative membrane protein